MTGRPTYARSSIAMAIANDSIGEHLQPRGFGDSRWRLPFCTRTSLLQQCPVMDRGRVGGRKQDAKYVAFLVALDRESPKGVDAEGGGGGGKTEPYHSNATRNPGPILQHVYLQPTFVRLCNSEDHPRTCSIHN